MGIDLSSRVAGQQERGGVVASFPTDGFEELSAMRALRRTTAPRGEGQRREDSSPDRRRESGLGADPRPAAPTPPYPMPELPEAPVPIREVPRPEIVRPVSGAESLEERVPGAEEVVLEGEVSGRLEERRGLPEEDEDGPLVADSRDELIRQRLQLGAEASEGAGRRADPSFAGELFHIEV